jgi:hypothetical protein
MINLFKPFKPDYDKIEVLQQELLKKNLDISHKIDDLNKSITKINSIGNYNDDQ